MKKPKAPRLVTIAITTTITIIFWIFFTLYRVLTTKPAPSVNPKLLEPINAELDINSLEQIKNKVFFDANAYIAPQNLPQNNIQELTPTPVQKEATESGQINQ